MQGLIPAKWAPGTCYGFWRAAADVAAIAPPHPDMCDIPTDCGLIWLRYDRQQLIQLQHFTWFWPQTSLQL
jgi:hypothetical protein